MSGEPTMAEEHFARLAFRHLEGLATAAERADLAALLRQEPGRLAQFTLLARQHGLLGELLAVPGASPAPLAVGEPIGGATQVLRRGSRRMRTSRRRAAGGMGWLAAAAALLVVVLGGVVALHDGREVVGRLESATTIRAQGVPVRVGDRLAGGGDGYLVLRDGSRIGLTAGATLTVATADRLVLASGIVLVHAAPRGATALVIETPQAQARVLGTRFQVSVDGPRTRLDVDEGLVRFTRNADGAALEVPAAAWAEVASGAPFVVHLRAQPPTPAPDPFVCGVNLKGSAVTIDGKRWWSQDEAVANGLVLPQPHLVAHTDIAPVPPVEAAVAGMLNTAVHLIGEALPLGLPLADGAYTVELWLMENHASGHRSLTIAIEGTVVARRVQEGDPLGAWHRLRYPVEVRDGRLDLVIGGPGESAHLMGFTVRRR